MSDLVIVRRVGTRLRRVDLNDTLIELDTDYALLPVADGATVTAKKEWRCYAKSGFRCLPGKNSTDTAIRDKHRLATKGCGWVWVVTEVQ